MRCCGRTLKLGRSRAFFIAEVLLSVLILSLISAIFFAPFKNGMHLLRLLRDRRIAQQRILRMLTNPHVHVLPSLPAGSASASLRHA